MPLPLHLAVEVLLDFDLSFQVKVINQSMIMVQPAPIPPLVPPQNIPQGQAQTLPPVYQKYLILLQDCNSTTHDLSNNSQNINDKLTLFVGDNGRFSHKVKALSNAAFIDPIQNIFKKMLFLRYFDCPNQVRFLNDYTKLFQLTHIINRERVISY